MEFLLVHFSESRRVTIDGRPSGMTEEIIEVVRGHHLVNLDPPPASSPDGKSAEIVDTNELDPYVLSFD